MTLISKCSNFAYTCSGYAWGKTQASYNVTKYLSSGVIDVPPVSISKPYNRSKSCIWSIRTIKFLTRTCIIGITGVAAKVGITKLAATAVGTTLRLNVALRLASSFAPKTLVAAGIVTVLALGAIASYRVERS
jgi:hypothetical protein